MGLALTTPTVRRHVGGMKVGKPPKARERCDEHTLARHNAPKQAPADEGAAQHEEGQVEVGASSGAATQATGAMPPGPRALHHPPKAPQPLGGLDPAAGDARRDAPSAQGGTATAEIVARIGVPLGGPFPGSAGGHADGVAGVHGACQTFPVVDVGGGGCGGGRDAVAVHDPVTLGAEPAAIGRILAGVLPASGRREPGRVQGGARPVDPAARPRPIQQRPVERRPHAGVLPIAQAPPARHAAATAEFLREQLPGDATLHDKQDAGESGAIRDTRTTALGLGPLRRQEGGEHRPQGVGDERLAHPGAHRRPQPVRLAALNFHKRAAASPKNNSATLARALKKDDCTCRRRHQQCYKTRRLQTELASLCPQVHAALPLHTTYRGQRPQPTITRASDCEGDRESLALSASKYHKQYRVCHHFSRTDPHNKHPFQPTHQQSLS